MVSPEPLSDSSNSALVRLRALLDESSFDGEQRLPAERVLAAQIGIGRRALRRALEVLEAEGRIWRHQGKGTFLGPRPARAPTSLDELSKRTHPLEVMDVRLEIEPALARLAAMRATNGDIERLLHLAEKTASSSDADGRELWDSALHRTIAEAAGNSLLLAIFDLVDRIRQDTTWRLLRERARSGNRQQLYVEQHRRVIAAIAQREAHAAEQAMREHLELVRDSLLKVMTSPLPARIDGEIPAKMMSANTKNERHHGT
ncbi:FadR family transcriptional regulator [Microvirga aerilata]|jgi:DNA-binding FadR family transcriptional regulator|uniref:FadR family transcriptional regulator n=2 Tax=Microvirga aerilata TaxID=670292 RepID=A0A936ZD13_9HYPH|nr:FCD domain-containing protein [Microvirga aerilata]MBL0402564.1 FadR family transcriptional regulator [Microvirga aerilata]